MHTDHFHFWHDEMGTVACPGLVEMVWDGLLQREFRFYSLVGRMRVIPTRETFPLYFYVNTLTLDTRNVVCSLGGVIPPTHVCRRVHHGISQHRSSSLL